jgi:hypothetical protein
MPSNLLNVSRSSAKTFTAKIINSCTCSHTYIT